MTVLVTGGTGRLGGALVARLDRPRVLSRREGPGRIVGDLSTGAGVDEAVAGASVIVHCATAPRATPPRPSGSSRPPAGPATRTWCSSRSSAPTRSRWVLPREGPRRAESSRPPACRGRSCAPRSSTTSWTGVRRCRPHRRPPGAGGHVVPAGRGVRRRRPPRRPRGRPRPGPGDRQGGPEVRPMADLGARVVGRHRPATPGRPAAPAGGDRPGLPRRRPPRARARRRRRHLRAVPRRPGGVAR